MTDTGLDNMYVMATRDDDGDLHLFHTYATSLAAAKDSVFHDSAEVYHLVKHEDPDGVWNVYTDDGALVFRTELEAYRYAFNYYHSDDVVEFKNFYGDAQ